MSNRYDVERESRPLHLDRRSFSGPTVLFALALLPLAAAVAGLVSPTSGLMLGGALFVAGALEATVGHAAAVRDRAKADRLLLAGHRSSPELEWRAEELTSERQRKALAKSLHALVASLGQNVVMTAQVVNRPAARAQRARLTAIGDRLLRLEKPVSARGVLMVRRLLADGGSPLYDRRHADELPERLDILLRALEPRR